MRDRYDIAINIYLYCALIMVYVIYKFENTLLFNKNTNPNNNAAFLFPFSFNNGGFLIKTEFIYINWR